MKLLHLVAFLLAPGVALMSCGDRFNSSPFGPVGGQAGNANIEGGSAGNTSTDGGSAGDTAGGAGNAGGSAGNTAGSAAGGESGRSGMAGEAGLGGEHAGPEPPVPTEGLVLWLRATQGVQHENSIVFGWADQSGSGNDATQTAENVMPKLDPGALGGQPALVFDEDDFLRLPAGFGDFSQGLTVFTVAQFDQDVCVGLLTLSNGSEIDDISVGRYNGAFLYEVADNWDESAPLALGAPALLTVVHRASEAIELRINQLLAAEPSWPLPAVVERLENVVGRSGYPGCSALQGKLSELLVYTRTIGDDELVAIESYLQQEWSCCQ